MSSTPKRIPRPPSEGIGDMRSTPAAHARSVAAAGTTRRLKKLFGGRAIRHLCAKKGGGK